MSQWLALLKLTGVYQEQVMGLYNNDVIPMEVRQYLAPWIESQDWKRAARDRSMANVQFQNLLEHLDTQYSRFTQEQEILQQHNFRRFKLNIQDRYQKDPQELAMLIRDLLNQEKKILAETQEVQAQGVSAMQLPIETKRQLAIEHRVCEVKQRVQSVDQESKFLLDQQETFDFKYSNFQLMSKANPTDPRLKAKQNELQCCLNDLDIKRKEILDQVKEMLGLLETLLDFLLQEFEDWQKRQAFFCIGAPTGTCHKLLEGWVTKTAEVFFQLRRILDFLTQLSCQTTYANDPLKTDPPILNQRLLEMLCVLLKKSFVVDKQPIMSFPCKRHLVLKTSTQFSVRARFLVNLPNLSHNMKVAYFVDKNPPNIKGYRKFNLLGPTSKCMEDSQGGGLAVEYKHLTLKEQKIGTGGKGSKGANDGSISIMEELHLITFTTQFNYQGLNLELEVATMPFVIISNIGQFVNAWASVIWFNLLSSDPKDLNFFSKPPAAPWLLLADALSWQFMCSTKRGLNPEQLTMLGAKLCDGMDPREDSIVTWSKFSKENMPEGPFTFWIWFDAILALVKEHLENIWNDGYIMGFVSRKKERSLLKTKCTGTFLLRFSESIKDGGITFSWVEHQANGRSDIRSVEPYTKKELKSIPFIEIIRNYQLMPDENIPENPLKNLYPNIPKDQAFGPYYEHKTELTLEYEKYLKRKMMFVSKRNDDDLDPETPTLTNVTESELQSILNAKSPLDLLQEYWELENSPEKVAVVPCVLELRDKLETLTGQVQQNLASAQTKQKAEDFQYSSCMLTDTDPMMPALDFQ